MQDLKFYLLIEGKDKDSEVRIDGNLETLRDFLGALGIDFMSADALPIDQPQLKREEVQHVETPN